MLMCGIFGCLLKSGKVAPIIHQGLKSLEYRGYDSAGQATIHRGKLYVKKDRGKINDVHERLNFDNMPGRIGIGHTRWATHGAPSLENAHPFVDCNGEIAIAHNGIIENFYQLREELIERGHRFISRTDSEVIVHLIEENMNKGLSFVEATREAARRLEGAYAVVAIYTKEPDKIVCLRKESPLVIGVGKEGIYCASDIPAFLPLTNNALVLHNGECAIVQEDGFEIRRLDDWKVVSREPNAFPWTPEMAEKGGYPHFMLKEIHEQPLSLKNSIRVQEMYLDLMATFMDRAKSIYLMACGTSYHACLAASYIFSNIARVQATPVIASEFIQCYGEAANIDSLVLAVSQSGETLDTLSAVMYARNRAATILGLTNVIGSTLTRVSRVYLCQQSGPEIGVAATKTYTSQLAVLTKLAIKLGLMRGKVAHKRAENLIQMLHSLPRKVEEVLEGQEQRIRELAVKYRDKMCFLFLGRGISTATSAEGNLKLLEITYVPSITYPAGESKHGPISLIYEGFPVVFVCPKDETHKAVIGNIMEMKARGASIIAIIEEGDEEIKRLADDYIEVPKLDDPIFTPILYVIPLQLFAYYMSVEKGLNPDQPRSLAKSVTVL